MFFTSGTTGRPKAVVQTQLNQLSALTAMFVHNRMRYGSEVVLNVMPLFNNFGASGIMNTCVFAGASMVLLERWDCAKALDLITEHQVTMLLGTPPSTSTSASSTTLPDTTCPTSGLPSLPVPVPRPP